MRTTKEKLGLSWLTPEYFTTGWQYFFNEEAVIVMVWMLGIMSLNIMCGCGGCLSVWKVALFAVLLRRFLAGGICTSQKRMDGMLVVITGANVGIGKETALDMAERGAEVVLACRDLTKANRTVEEIRFKTSGRVSAMQLDLTSFESIKSFAKEFGTKYDKLDVLVNNAGIMMCPEGKTKEGFELQMGTNHLGHFLLTSLMVTHLEKSEEPRIINVSSLGHWFAKLNLNDINLSKNYNRSVAYGNSKLANILFTREFNRRFSDSKIRAYALHPGTVQSDLGRHLPFNLAALHRNWIKLIYKTTSEGTQTTLHCILEAKPTEHSYFADCAPANLSDAARDDKLAKELWTLSEKLCKVDFKSKKTS